MSDDVKAEAVKATWTDATAAIDAAKLELGEQAPAKELLRAAINKLEAQERAVTWPRIQALLQSLRVASRGVSTEGYRTLQLTGREWAEVCVLAGTPDGP